MEALNEVLGDGLEILRKEFALVAIMEIIEKTARWVDPATFKLLPLWYPEYARGNDLYDRTWSEHYKNKSQQTGRVQDKREGNVQANKALTYALGLRSAERRNWSCCHIWGPDDPKFKDTNKVVKDHRFYSCVANMVLLPTPLKAFTDAMPDVKVMLRLCSANMYGWRCDHETSRGRALKADGMERLERVSQKLAQDAYGPLAAGRDENR